MPNSHICQICGKSYTQSGTLNRHYRTTHFTEPPRDHTRDHGYHPYHLPAAFPQPQFGVYQPNYYEAPPPPPAYPMSSNPDDDMLNYLGQQLAEIYPDLDLGQPDQPSVQPTVFDQPAWVQPAFDQSAWVQPSASFIDPTWVQQEQPPISWHLPDDIDLTTGYQPLDQPGPSGYQPPHPRKDRENALQCHICDKYFSTRSCLIGHIRYVHNKEKRPQRCDSSSSDDTSYPESPPEIPNSSEIPNSPEHWEQRNHRIAGRVEGFRENRVFPELNPTNIFIETISAFNQMVTEHTATVNREMVPEHFLELVQPDLEELLHYLLARYGPVKTQIVLNVKFYKLGGTNFDEVVATSSAFFMNCFTPLLNTWEIPKLLKAAFTHILKNLGNYQVDGSGWLLDAIESISVIKSDFLPLAGAGGGSWDLGFLNHKQKASVISHPSLNEKCFATAIAASLLHKSKNLYAAYDRVALDEKIASLDFSNITFPVSFNDIAKFEKKNEIAVHVFGFSHYLYPLRVSDTRYDTKVHLMLIEGESENHYCTITDLGIFAVGSGRNSAFICESCLMTCFAQNKYDQHIILCRENKPQRIELAKDGEQMKFKNFSKMVKSPYIAYADFGQKCTLGSFSIFPP